MGNLAGWLAVIRSIEAVIFPMNESSFLPPPGSAIKGMDVSSQRVAVVLRMPSLFAQVVDRRRIVVLS
jgi:hypothetical protein